MYTADSSGRLHPVASSAILPGSQLLDRHAVAALRDDCAEMQRISDSGAARISPHVVAWTRLSGDIDSRRSVHHASNGAGASAPLSFASDRLPMFESHECVSGLCLRPFPPMFVETCLQRYGSASTSSDASERATAALQLEELFVAQCCQLLHGLRFGAGSGRDLFAPSLLTDIDEWMRAALMRGEAKGRRAAEEALGVPVEEMAPLPSPRGSHSGGEPYRKSSSLDRASTLAAESTYATASAAQQQADGLSTSDRARQRRATQNPSVSMIHHPFAPAAYEGAAADGSVSARFIGGASEGRSGRGLSRRAQGAAAAASASQHRPRQCFLSSLLGLIRFTNALATRLKYWRGQIKAKQQEITTLTAMAQANANKEAAVIAAPAADAATQRQLQQALDRITSLESSLASATATLHEYESSGRPRNQHEYNIGDDHIPWGANELADLHAGWNRERAQLQRSLEEARADATALRDADRQRTTTVESLQGQNESLTARVSQLSSMLDAIKVRVGTREQEWEAKEAEWTRKHKADSCGLDSAAAASSSSAATPSSPSAALTALREELAAEKARHAAAHAKAEAEWFAQMAARDAKEQSLHTTAIRAKQAHASVVRDYEDLRQENVRVQAAVDEEKKEMENRLRKNNGALTDARSTIAALKSQIKKLQESATTAAPTHTAVSAPAESNGATRAAKEERLAKKREAAAAAEAQLQAEEEEAERAAQEQRQKDALAAAEKIKAAAAARAKKEKQKKRAEAEAAAAAATAEAVAAEAAAAAQSAAADKSRQKKKRDASAPQPPQQPLLPPPTAAELSKPTPKLSSGYGRCVYEEGEWYEGWWVDFQRSGQGEYHWKDGRRYFGEWLHDKKHGQGEHFWIDGDRFRGEYANDKMDGWGTYYFADKTSIEGEWSADMSHGRATVRYNDGARFEGTFSRDQKHGPGKMYLPSGECFSEHWINGKRISSISIKPHDATQQQPQPQPQPLPPQAQPPQMPKGLSRIRMAAQEQLAAATAAQSARGPGGRR